MYRVLKGKRQARHPASFRRWAVVIPVSTAPMIATSVLTSLLMDGNSGSFPSSFQ